MPERSRRHLAGVAVVLLFALQPAAWPRALSAGDEGVAPIGARPPEWDGLEWVRGGPLTLEQLRGRVVLVRWWTGPGCPFCSASAPLLEALHERFARRGLVVVGLYHHKSGGRPTSEQVRRLADDLGFRFPLAIDSEWRNLRRWWLDRRDREYTSVSFLLDRDGSIRYLHPGGAFSEEESGRIEALIARLLS